MMGKLKLALPAVVLVGAACFSGVTVSTEPNRVEAARSEKSTVVRNLVKQAGLTYPVRKIYIRAFKEERELEVWGSDSSDGPYSLIHTYKVAAASGDLGPKRTEGDRQVPEGFYTIDRFNPESAFHLSLGLNYPNASDKILSDKERPGTDIFIHGNQVSIGCLAMTDDKIKEIFLLALDAKPNGPIPVHIFPARLSEPKLTVLAKDHPQELVEFWRTLLPAQHAFDKTKKLPKIEVLKTGQYRVLQ
jgi:murein L,D-transpeptidase YafK